MPELKRSLGLLSCTLMGVGVILGAGIYALVGKAAGLGGNAVWISFVAAAVVASFTGLSYAELASFIPKAGGEYYYVQRAFGKTAAFLLTWLLLVALCIASAAVALGFGGYFEALTGVGKVPSAVGLLVGCALLLFRGIRESAAFAGFAALLEVAGLLVIMAIGLPHLGEVDLLEMPDTGWRGVTAAASLIFFAFIGFEEIVQLAEETEDPARNIPLALVLSIVITTVIYVLVAVAAVSVMGWEALGASASPLADVAEQGMGANLSFAISSIALFSTANTVLILVLSSSRLLYGLGEDGGLPEVFARIHPGRQTPWVATVTITLVSMAVAVAFQRIESVASVVNFAIFLTFLMINGTVIALRLQEPEAHRPFRIPGSVAGIPLLPVAGIVSVLALMGETSLFTASLGLAIVGAGGLVRLAYDRSGR